MKQCVRACKEIELAAQLREILAECNFDAGIFIRIQDSGRNSGQVGQANRPRKKSGLPPHERKSMPLGQANPARKRVHDTLSDIYCRCQKVGRASRGSLRSQFSHQDKVSGISLYPLVPCGKN